VARSTIRVATPGDAPALRALLEEAGMRMPNSEPALLAWKYWKERPDWSGPRSFVATRGNEILAHAAVIPGTCLSQGEGARRVRTLHLIDWAARPGAPGAGVLLLKYLGQSTDALLSIGGSHQTLQLLPHLGFHASHPATCYVRPLHPVYILTPSVHPVSRLLPRLARSMLWDLRAPSGGTDGWKVRRVESGDLSGLSAVLPEPTGNLAVFERGENLFRYFLDCPIVPMELYALERDGRVRGYFLLAFALRQARLVDCWVDSRDPADWRALIQSAVSVAKHTRRSAELAVWGSDTDLSERLRECGFHSRGELPVQVRAPRHPQLDDFTLRVHMLDNDAAYRHVGRNEFWA
jgi:hypothetical protein